MHINMLLNIAKYTLKINNKNYNYKYNSNMYNNINN